MTLNALYQVVDHQEVGGVEVLNVYYYLGFSATGTALDILQSFDAQILQGVRGIQDQGIVHLRRTCVDLFDPADAAEIVDAAPGLHPAGEPMAPFITWVFSLTPEGGEVRPGRKSYGGLSEAMTGDGKTPVVSFAPNLETMAAYLISGLIDIVAPAIVHGMPIIVGRIGSEILGYRLPETFSEMLTEGFEFVASALLGNVSSQVSRKYEE